LAVHSLQSADGGILDPDDRLLDVVDDREQIIANFEDDDTNARHITGAPTHHVGDRGDGASAGGSSVGSSSAGGNSPDLFMTHMHPPVSHHIFFSLVK
jgi:partitioning defective protein 3